MITVKTSEEIKILREGGKRHAQIIEILAGKVAPGISTNELNDLASKLISQEGDKAAFLNYRPDGARRKYPAALCVSLNSEIVHGIPNENPRLIKEGDLVSLDLGLSHLGLITDMAVTVGVGKLDKKDSQLIKATREALSVGIKEARLGNHMGDIGFAIEKVAKKYDLRVVEGLAGHGVGYNVHEDPYVPNTGRPGEGEILKSGMVLAIEPMFCFGSGQIVADKDGFTFKTKDDKNSAHFEHTVAITDEGPLILTKV